MKLGSTRPPKKLRLENVIPFPSLTLEQLKIALDERVQPDRRVNPAIGYSTGDDRRIRNRRRIDG